MCAPQSILLYSTLLYSTYSTGAFCCNYFSTLSGNTGSRHQASRISTFPSSGLLPNDKYRSRHREYEVPSVLLDPTRTHR